MSKSLSVALALLMMIGGSAVALGEASSVDLTMEAAKEIALTHAQLTEADVRMTKMSQDYDDGRMEYEIDFALADVEYEYEIDAETGAVLKSSTETLDAREAEALQGIYVSFDEARAAALEAAGILAENAEITEIQLEYDDGQLEYEIEFTSDGIEHKVKLYAGTGEVLKHTTESANADKD